MKWFILFLAICGVTTLVLTRQMPFANGDDVQRFSDFSEQPAADADAEVWTAVAQSEVSSGKRPVSSDRVRFEDQPAEEGSEELTAPGKRHVVQVQLQKVQAKRALEFLKQTGGRRHMAMGIDEETNTLILSGGREPVEMAKKTLQLLDQGRSEGVRRTPDDENERSGEDPFSRESEDSEEQVGSRGEDENQKFEFWLGFPRDEEVEELLAQRVEQLKKAESQAEETQRALAVAIARRRDQRDGRNAERARRDIQQQLEEAVEKAFDLRQQVQRLQVYRLRSRLAEVTDKMNQREELRKRILSQRVSRLTREAEAMAKEHLKGVEKSGPEGAAAGPDVWELELASEEFRAAAREDALARATVRITWSFTEDFGRRVRQVHRTGTICGATGGSTLVVTVTPELPAEEASSITVRSPDAKPYFAQVAAVDRETGLMLLKSEIDYGQALPIETAPEVGLAIRASWTTGSGLADSAGIVSSVGRQIGRRKLIQHDIAAPPEAAGGPIVNRKGRLIGLMALQEEEIPGLAVPAVEIRRLMENDIQMIERGNGVRSEEFLTAFDASQKMPLEILEIRRELVDAEHAVIAADRERARLAELDKLSDSIISRGEFERAHLNYDRARDMHAATKRIFEARVRLLEQQMRNTGEAIENLQNEINEATARTADASPSQVQQSYVDKLKTEMKVLQGSLVRQQAILQSLGLTEGEKPGSENESTERSTE